LVNKTGLVSFSYSFDLFVDKLESDDSPPMDMIAVWVRTSVTLNND